MPTTLEPVQEDHPGADAAVSGEPVPMTRQPSLRVLHVTPSYLPDVTAPAFAVARIVTALHRHHGLDMSVLTTDHGGQLDTEELVEGIPVIREPAWPREQDFAVSPALARRIARGYWDVVHFHVADTGVPVLALRAAARAELPYLVTFHGAAPRTPAAVGLLRRAGRLLATTPDCRLRASALTGVTVDPVSDDATDLEFVYRSLSVTT